MNDSRWKLAEEALPHDGRQVLVWGSGECDVDDRFGVSSHDYMWGWDGDLDELRQAGAI